MARDVTANQATFRFQSYAVIMKTLVLTTILLHLIGVVLVVEAGIQEDCVKQRQLGGTCEESEWVCHGKFMDKTFKFTYKNGTKGCTRTLRHYPCKGARNSGGTPSASKDCKDRRPKIVCDHWKGLGYCTKGYTAFVKSRCCKTCEGEGASNANGNSAAVDGGYGQWSRWSVCTKTCNGGNQVARRQCNSPAPSNGGRKCLGPAKRWKRCNKQQCPGCVDKWRICSVWEKDGYCTEGRYVRFMTTHCCSSCGGGSTTTLMPPVNGGYSEWGEWSTCSETCGNGRKMARRQCNNPSPSNGGRKCEGPAVTFQVCNEQNCTEKEETGSNGTNVCLQSANFYRRRHQNTPDFTWDSVLAAKATVYANVLMRNALQNGGSGEVLVHETEANESEGMGENLWYEDHSNTGDDGYYCKRADHAWYNEIYDYSYDSGMSINGKPVGHFTQMVWKASTAVGYGVAVANSPIFERNKMAIVVAKYKPAGNFHIFGQRLKWYSDNVGLVKSNAEAIPSIP